MKWRVALLMMLTGTAGVIARQPPANQPPTFRIDSSATFRSACGEPRG